jgi:hypothetical protein
MEILTAALASHHRPLGKSIEIYCNNYGKRRDVKGKTLLFALFFSFTLMFPVSAAMVILTTNFLRH